MNLHLDVNSSRRRDLTVVVYPDGTVELVMYVGDKKLPRFGSVAELPQLVLEYMAMVDLAHRKPGSTSLYGRRVKVFGALTEPTGTERTYYVLDMSEEEEAIVRAAAGG